MLQFLTELPSKRSYELQRASSDFLAAWEREKPLILEDAAQTLPLAGLYLWRENKMPSASFTADDLSQAILASIELQLKKIAPTGDIR